MSTTLPILLAASQPHLSAVLLRDLVDQDVHYTTRKLGLPWLLCETHLATRPARQRIKYQRCNEDCRVIVSLNCERCYGEGARS